MADTKSTDARVLRILADQAPDYLIHPTASAFAAEELSAEEVEEALGRLAEQGHAILMEEVMQRFAVEPVLVEGADGEKLHAMNDNGVHLYQQKLDEKGEPVIEPATDDDGNEIVVEAGWEATDAGRKKAGDPVAAAAAEEAAAAISDDELAKLVRDHYRKGAAPAYEVAEELGVDPERVHVILDEYTPSGRGVKRLGPGLGHGWLREQDPAE